MANPDWMEWIKWLPPHRLADLVANPTSVPTYNGFYVFNLDYDKLHKDRVLYVGECHRDHGFQARFRDYLHPDPKTAKTKHKAALFLQDYRLTYPSRTVYVRFCPMDTDKQTRRDLEAAIMQYYNAWFNSRDMRYATPFDTL